MNSTKWQNPISHRADKSQFIEWNTGSLPEEKALSLAGSFYDILAMFFLHRCNNLNSFQTYYQSISINKYFVLRETSGGPE